MTSLRRLKFSQQVRAFTEHGALAAMPMKAAFHVWPAMLVDKPTNGSNHRNTSTGNQSGWGNL